MSKWMTIGLLCAACGLMGCPPEDSGPTSQGGSSSGATDNGGAGGSGGTDTGSGSSSGSAGGGDTGTSSGGGSEGCEPGTTWDDDCNTCFCDDDGNAACTEIACNVDEPDAGSGTDNEVCELPQVTGPCEAAIPAFWFNAESGECESFIYGGCQGNENNFPTKAECEAACGGGSAGTGDDCESCLAGGGTWQPEANECTADCDIADISCFTNSCPGSCEDDCSFCFSQDECSAAGCSWQQASEAMWCTD